MINVNLPSIHNLPCPNLSIINLPPINLNTQELSQKLFSCEHCSTTFSRKNSLMRHMRIHTGYKPYSCRACNKSFSRKDILDKHKDSLKCMKNTSIPSVPQTLSSSCSPQSLISRSPTPLESRMSISSLLSDSTNDFNSEFS